MVATKRIRPEQEGRGDVLSELFRFHGRIRSALVQLAGLAGVSVVGDAERESAADLLAFFRGPLLWHDIDEETSLLPRLKRAVCTAEELEVLCAISTDHEHMEETVDEVVLSLEALLNATDLNAVRRLPELAERLRAILHPHLALEERHLLPLARRLLSDDDLDRMRREIDTRNRLRRAGVRSVVALG
jgi:iron-sulfur cluster repair protein YtfE (RIC family)